MILPIVAYVKLHAGGRKPNDAEAVEWVPSITVERGEAIGEGLKTAAGGKESDNLMGVLKCLRHSSAPMNAVFLTESLK